MSEAALELFKGGDFDGAKKMCSERLREKPTDVESRGLYCTLLCFDRDWDRADKQLELIGTQDAESRVGTSLLRQLIRAEIARGQFFTEGRVPEIVADPSEVVQLHLQASIAIREGDLSQANDLLTQAKEKRTPVKGTMNGNEFEDMFDLDDLIGPVFEVLTTNGKYYWVPIENIQTLEFREPKHARDLLWRSATIAVSEGPQGEVFFPCTYFVGAETAVDTKIKLGEETDWFGEEGEPIRGQGRRMIVVGEEAVSLLELNTLEVAGS